MNRLATSPVAVSIVKVPDIGFAYLSTDGAEPILFTAGFLAVSCRQLNEIECIFQHCCARCEFDFPLFSSQSICCYAPIAELFGR